MRIILAILLVVGFMFTACEPSTKDKLKAAQENIEDAAEEVLEEVEEAAEDLEEAASEVEVDTVAVKGEGKKFKKLFGKLKKKK